MAHETAGLGSTGSISLTGRWTAEIGSWFRARRERHVRNQYVLHMLSYDERLLEDIGLSRSELVGELGHDPCELPEWFGAKIYRGPHL